MTTTHPFELFVQECPEIASAFGKLVEEQRRAKALDDKTKHLINIAIQTANRNAHGVFFHAQLAKSVGATRAEVVQAVVMNLHLSGLAAVLDALPQAIAGFTAD